MMYPFLSDVGRDKFEDGSGDHIPLSVHFLTLRISFYLEELKTVHEERLQLFLYVTLLSLLTLLIIL